ncbi:aldehyde dehydrogenase family protein, partial [Brevibacterium paucivorans]
DSSSTKRVRNWIAQAVDAGAEVLAGGDNDDRAIRPTVLADVPQGVQAWDEEVFGPVIG